MRRWWLTTVPALLVFVISGCRTSERLGSVRTEYQTIIKTDSVWTYKTDTVRVFVIGDTVRIFEKQTHTEKYYTIYRDTLRLADTLRMERIVQVGASESPKRIKWWRWFLAGGGVTLFIIFAVKIVKKIYLKR